MRIFLFVSAFLALTAFASSGVIDNNFISTTNNKISVGFVGDMVPSTDSIYNESVFDNVSSLLSTPDLMIGNLEGTFAHVDRLSKCEYLKTMCHAFRGDPSFADALKNAGFDFVSLVNNHSYDFGKEGLSDTQAELDRVGIKYVTSETPSKSVEVRGKRVGILGLSSTDPWKSITDYDFIKNSVNQLAEENDFVIVIFHGGAEGSDKSVVPMQEEWVGTENRGDVYKVAHIAVNAGADLVLGAGPHVLRKIEVYKNATIAYSMGNFVGAKKLITKGVLAYSGIFTTTLKQDSAPKYNFTSIILSKTGVPSLDETNQSEIFLENLK